MTIDLSSTAFREGADIPKQYTGDGDDVSPPLQWSDPPPATRSFALICDDSDAPRGTWVHWVLFNLPGDQRQLEEGVPTKEVLDNGAKQGRNDFKKIGYGGRLRRLASRIATSSSSTRWRPRSTWPPAQPRISC